MMLIDKLKADQIAARKNRDAIKATLLTTLLGEAQRPGKDDGNRQSTDEEVNGVIKKFLKGVNDTKKLVTDEAKLTELTVEAAVYQAYLPTKIEGEDLKQYIVGLIAEQEAPSIKSIMSAIQEKFTCDGKEASGYIKELLAK